MVLLRPSCPPLNQRMDFYHENGRKNRFNFLRFWRFCAMPKTFSPHFVLSRREEKSELQFIFSCVLIPSRKAADADGRLSSMLPLKSLHFQPTSRILGAGESGGATEEEAKLSGLNAN
jgi:hypothetical protein